MKAATLEYGSEQILCHFDESRLVHEKMLADVTSLFRT
jgi:hypothetical protein